MTSRDPCTVCQLADQTTEGGATPNSYRTHCQRCGDYDWKIGSRLNGRAARHVKMSGFIQSQNRVGIVPSFDNDLIAYVEQLRMPSLRERCDLLLGAIVNLVGYSKTLVDMGIEQKMLAISYSKDVADIEPLLDILEMNHFIKRQYGEAVELTPNGYLEVDGWGTRQSASAQGFVAMSFDDSMNSAFTEGFEPAIRSAGYRAMRIDKKEHANGISDEIMAEIRRSRFVVADYSQLNNGVYFEAGFAIGSGVTVIPTCRKDFLPQLHFDIRHINTLQWSEPSDLRDSLQQRIQAIIGQGPLASV